MGFLFMWGETMSKKWTKEEIIVLQKYYGKLRADVIHTKYLPNRTSRAIISKANKIGLIWQNLWTKEEIKILKKNYKKLKVKECQKLLSRHTITSITCKANELSIKHDQYQYNKEYFSNTNIDTCYWAGFIAADGCLRAARKYSGVETVIDVSQKDRSILVKFKKDIKYNGTIVDYEVFDKKYNKIRYHSKIDICGCTKWHEDLNIYWNIVPQKTRILQPPNLNMKSINALAYCRGYLDGDGSIFYENKNKLRFNICGTKQVIEWISKNINLENNISFNKHNKLYYVRGSGNVVIKSLYSLYQLNVPYNMKRKWGKLDEYYKQ